ncbi:MAG: DNA-processing protein DprA [Blautia sp.]|nr:DNA-processing protein DprA [Blautia sp.]
MEETLSYSVCKVKNTEADYPPKLKNYPDMPEVLYCRGTLPDPEKPSIAIVGARACSPYGRVQAFRYARALSQAGVQVISGLAYGIDAESHKGALRGETPTFAVLGCGADCCYPKNNRKLYEEILWKDGGIISEYSPGTPAVAWHFPARNRIISALADVVLVVEAKDHSGSLITARYALEQGKSVYAIPGAVSDELSLGCHKLIYDGAGIAYSPEILLCEWGILNKNDKKQDEKKKLGLASDLNMVYSCLDLRPKNPDYIVRKTGFPAWKVSNLLLELQLMGLIRENGRHYYVRQE